MNTTLHRSGHILILTSVILGLHEAVVPIGVMAKLVGYVCLVLDDWPQLIKLITRAICIAVLAFILIVHEGYGSIPIVVEDTTLLVAGQ